MRDEVNIMQKEIGEFKKDKIVEKENVKDEIKNDNDDDDNEDYSFDENSLEKERMEVEILKQIWNNLQKGIYTKKNDEEKKEKYFKN